MQSAHPANTPWEESTKVRSSAVSCVLYPDELSLARMLALRSRDLHRKYRSGMEQEFGGLFTRLEYAGRDSHSDVVRLQPDDLKWLVHLLIGALGQAE